MRTKTDLEVDYLGAVAGAIDHLFHLEVSEGDLVREAVFVEGQHIRALSPCCLTCTVSRAG